MNSFEFWMHYWDGVDEKERDYVKMYSNKKEAITEAKNNLSCKDVLSVTVTDTTKCEVVFNVNLEGSHS